MNISLYSHYIKMNVIDAYLRRGFSQRRIQKEILNLPAPNNGGGYIAMKILHEFGISGVHKNIISDRNIPDKIITEYKKIKIPLLLLKEFYRESYNAKLEPINVITSSKSLTIVRQHQNDIRKEVIHNYECRCALCDINNEELLIASHIVPWSLSIENRLNAQNVICLCALHDKLFDRCFFSFDDNYQVIWSHKSDNNIKKLINQKTMRLPKRAIPDTKLLRFHRTQLCSIR